MINWEFFDKNSISALILEIYDSGVVMDILHSNALRRFIVPSEQ
jgi:hypothetical protein